MLKAFLVLLVGALGALPLSADTVTYYTDQATFLAAANAIPNTTTELETFGGSTLTTPGLSVLTDSYFQNTHLPGYGHIQDGSWDDCVGRSCGDLLNVSTTWGFAEPVYAFGATFIYPNAGDPTAIGISFGIPSGPIQYGLPPIENGFYGMISNEPFSSMLIVENDLRAVPPGIPNWEMRQSQFYTMDNLYLQTSAAEPAALLLTLVGIGFLVIRFRSKNTITTEDQGPNHRIVEKRPVANSGRLHLGFPTALCCRVKKLAPRAGILAQSSTMGLCRVDLTVENRQIPLRG